MAATQTKLKGETMGPVKGTKTVNGAFGKINLTWHGAWKEENAITGETVHHGSKVVASMETQWGKCYGEEQQSREITEADGHKWQAFGQSAIANLYAEFAKFRAIEDEQTALDTDWVTE